jgi:membrane protease YdiL (CAAX protease family)
MNLEYPDNRPIQPPEPAHYSVPWQPIDNWIGVILLAIIDLGLLVISLMGKKGQLAQSGLLVIVQLAYLLPVLIVFAYRRVPWKSLGFGKFNWGTLALGCGLLVASYMIIVIHNLILTGLGVQTQGDQISKLFELLNTPVWFFLVGALLAPLIEEIFFRGFLFQGLRARYGWVSGILISSAIFAIAHLDPAALIPTFILGCLLAYLYHRSNSIWPGVILHMLVNTFGLISVYVITQYPNLIPG